MQEGRGEKLTVLSVRAFLIAPYVSRKQYKAMSVLSIDLMESIKFNQ